MDISKIMSLPTAASAKDLATDVWDADNNCSYSQDGMKLLDAENFPGVVHVKDGTRIVCDEVFAFQPYMYEDAPLGSEIPLDDRVSYLEKVYLPSTVTHIGREAFRECGWVKSIRLPKSLLSIGESAFEGCWSLGSVGCPSSLVAIQDFAFRECFSLENIRLNRSLAVIGEGAFAFCESLREITLPPDLQYIGPDIFEYCKHLRKIFVPESCAEYYVEAIDPRFRKKVAVIKGQ